MIRPRRAVVASLLLLLPALAAGPAAPVQDQPPPGGDEAAEALAASPRHGEWVTVDAGDDGEVGAWLVYPERSGPAPVVVVIHEIFGMTDWIRSVADAFAAEGFIAIAPDLLSGKGPGGGGTESLEEPRRAIRDLDPGEVTRRLAATARHAMALPAATDSYGVVGFCWGGSTSFRYATESPGAGAAVVYYGTSPDAAALEGLGVPVLGLYAGDDERVNATIPPAREALAGSGLYEVEIYDGAGHGFLRALSHEERGAANREAAGQAWPRTIAFFREHLEE